MSEQAESLETQENPESTTQAPQLEPTKDTRTEEIQKDRLAQFASMLEEPSLETGDGEEEEEKGGAEKPKSDEKTKIKTLSDLSKKLGVNQAELYDVKVSLRDQETTVSLGELKDAYQESQDLDFEKIEWGEEKTKQEKELAAARKEIEVLASLIPKDSMTKENIEAAGNVIKGQMERSRQDVFRRIPEWEEEEIRKNELPKINEYLSQYGIQFSELTDSRLIHYIRNNWLREQRIEAALGKIKKVESKTTGPNNPTSIRARKGSKANITPKAKTIARNFLNQLED